MDQKRYQGDAARMVTEQANNACEPQVVKRYGAGFRRQRMEDMNLYRMVTQLFLKKRELFAECGECVVAARLFLAAGQHNIERVLGGQGDIGA